MIDSVTANLSIPQRVRDHGAITLEPDAPPKEKGPASLPNETVIKSDSQSLSSEIADAIAIQGSLAGGEATIGLASSAIMSVSDLVNDMRSVAYQATQESLGEVSRRALQSEFDGLRKKIDVVVAAANFGDVNLIQSGATGVSVLADKTGARIDIMPTDLSTSGLGLDALSIGSIDDSVEAIDAIDRAKGDINGALQSYSQAAEMIEDQSQNSRGLIDQVAGDIRNLVDTNLAQEGAIQQAQEVQVVLGTLSLAIANSKPDSIRALFE